MTISKIVGGGSNPSWDAKMTIRKREVIVTNKAQCKICKDIVESTHRHDFVTCKCGEISVDGGTDYIKRCAKDFNSVLELSETYEEEYESEW